MGEQAPYEQLWTEEEGCSPTEKSAHLRAFHQRWASLYRARLSQCDSIRGMAGRPELKRCAKDVADGTETYCIVRDRGRVIADINGNEAVFNSRAEAEFWLMPDERVVLRQSARDASV